MLTLTARDSVRWDPQAVGLRDGDVRSPLPASAIPESSRFCFFASLSLCGRASSASPHPRSPTAFCQKAVRSTVRPSTERKQLRHQLFATSPSDGQRSRGHPSAPVHMQIGIGARHQLPGGPILPDAQTSTGLVAYMPSKAYPSPSQALVPRRDARGILGGLVASTTCVIPPPQADPIRWEGQPVTALP